MSKINDEMCSSSRPAPPYHDHIVFYICFLFITSRELVDEKLIKIKIQCIQNKIYFKERLSTKQNLI